MQGDFNLDRRTKNDKVGDWSISATMWEKGLIRLVQTRNSHTN